MNKLSAVISAFNEEKKIEDCLKSVVHLAEEIIVVDNASTDNTSKIAKKYATKVYSQKNDPRLIDLQKNFGFEKATGDWILCLDADERITPELNEEIRGLLKNGESDTEGYYIPRKNIIFNKWIKHTGWYPDYQLRLFRREKGKFTKEHFHEAITLPGKVEYLKEHITHYNYESVSQFINRNINIYSPNEAEYLLKKGYIFNWADVVRFPLKEFLGRFFAREGYKDGFHGLVLSMLMAFCHLVVFARIWEIQGFKEIDSKDFLENTQKEFDNAHKEISYWFLNEKVKSAGSVFNKLHLKMRSKLKV